MSDGLTTYFSLACSVYSYIRVVWAEKPRSVKSTTIRLKSFSTAMSVVSCSCAMVLRSVGSIAVGLFMSIFSNVTETRNIALVFYIIIFVFVYLLLRILNYDVHKVLLLFGQFPMLEFYFSVAVCGLPTLFIHAWFFM